MQNLFWWIIPIAVLAAHTDAAELNDPTQKFFDNVVKCHDTGRTNNEPNTCILADKTKPYVILKDYRGKSQFLLVATDRRLGIEDPKIQDADAPNYFKESWSARHCVTNAPDRPADSQISLAINSVEGRSLGQLHIHIDWLRPEIKLNRHMTSYDFGVPPFVHHYLVWHIAGLDGVNLFTAAQSRSPGDIGDATIVVVGDADGGFYVLTDHAHDYDRASGEELQIDHSPLSKEDLNAASLRGCGQP